MRHLLFIINSKMCNIVDDLFILNVKLLCDFTMAHRLIKIYVFYKFFIYCVFDLYERKKWGLISIKLL